MAPHHVRGPRPPMPSHMYPTHRMMDPSPSGGGAINMSDQPSQHPPTTNAPTMKGDTHNYPRPPARYPPITTPSGQARTSPRPPIPMMGHIQQPRPTMNPYPPTQQPPPPSVSVSGGPPPPNYYGGYPPPPPNESLGSEDAMPPSAYQGSPYQDDYGGEPGPREPSDNSNSKSYGGEAEDAGEFGGLVSYFSSQREDDLDS